MEPEEIKDETTTTTEPATESEPESTVSPENDSGAVSDVSSEPTQDELETGTARTDIEPADDEVSAE